MTPEISPELAAALQERWTDEGSLVIWTVTTGTRDFGPRYVARPHKIGRGSATPMAVYLVADSLDKLRAMLPPGLTRMSRDPEDQAVIVENWI